MSKRAAKAPGVLVKASPLDLLLPYQIRWANDDARWKIGLMARQVGKDYSSGAEGIRDCFTHELITKDKTTWLIAAPSERQSLESLEKWKEWAEAFKLSIDDVVEDRDSSEAILKSSTITFPGGSRVIAVPGKPDTVRGYSANVLMTEFGFFEDPDATWRAILPSITNPLRGGLKKVRLISTPNGAGNKLHDLWTKNYQVAGSKWSAHKVTIYDAIDQGLPIDAEEIKAALDDPDGWAQEYLCEFIDAAGVLLSYELIASCESPEAGIAAPMEYWTSKTQFPVDLGIDFARKHDKTCCWALESVADLRITREVLTLRGMSTPEQIEILRPRIAKARRCAIDYTGPGVGFGDYLVKEFGEWNPDKHLFGKIELCTASNSFNQDIQSKLRMDFERRTLRVPFNRAIRESLHSVYRTYTKTGQIAYRAPHNDTGHADEEYALALVNHAASVPTAPGKILLLGTTKRSRIIAARSERSVSA